MLGPASPRRSWILAMVAATVKACTAAAWVLTPASSAVCRARGLLVADLRVPHVAREARVGGVGSIEDLFECPDRGLLIVGGLREPFLQQLLNRAEGVVAEEAGDRTGGAEKIFDVLNVAVHVAEHAFDGIDCR